MSAIFIARCPEHGLHGQRRECFVCGGPVEQVAMVPLVAERTFPRDVAPPDPATRPQGLPPAPGRIAEGDGSAAFFRAVAAQSRVAELESQVQRLLDHAARALERTQVADDTSGAADEATAILEQVVTLDGGYVHPRPNDG